MASTAKDASDVPSLPNEILSYIVELSIPEYKLSMIGRRDGWYGFRGFPPCKSLKTTCKLFRAAVKSGMPKAYSGHMEIFRGDAGARKKYFAPDVNWVFEQTTRATLCFPWNFICELLVESAMPNLRRIDIRDLDWFRKDEITDENIRNLYVTRPFVQFDNGRRSRRQDTQLSDKVQLIVHCPVTETSIDRREPSRKELLDVLEFDFMNEENGVTFRSTSKVEWGKYYDYITY